MKICFECGHPIERHHRNHMLFIVQGDSRYLHFMCATNILVAHITESLHREEHMNQSAETANKLGFCSTRSGEFVGRGFEFPNSSNHASVACTDNANICQLCGCHVNNHSSRIER